MSNKKISLGNLTAILNNKVDIKMETHLEKKSFLITKYIYQEKFDKYRIESFQTKFDDTENFRDDFCPRCSRHYKCNCNINDKNSFHHVSGKDLKKSLINAINQGFSFYW